MDITIEYYLHQLHWPYFWPLYSEYYKEVNGLDMSLMTNIEENGIIIQTTFLEQKVRTIINEHFLKVLIIRGEPEISAFVHYNPPEKDDELMHVEGIYVAKNKRKLGLCNMLLSTFGKGTKFTFNTLKENEPTRLLSGKKIKQIGETDKQYEWLVEIV